MAEDNPVLPSSTESRPMSTKLPKTWDIVSCSSICLHSEILHLKPDLWKALIYMTTIFFWVKKMAVWWAVSGVGTNHIFCVKMGPLTTSDMVQMKLCFGDLPNEQTEWKKPKSLLESDPAHSALKSPSSAAHIPPPRWASSPSICWPFGFLASLSREIKWDIFPLKCYFLYYVPCRAFAINVVYFDQ